MKEEIKYVVDNSKYVSINKNEIEGFINSLGDINYSHWSNELNLDLSEKKWILLAFIIESMNFCFWKKPNICSIKYAVIIAKCMGTWYY